MGRVLFLGVEGAGKSCLTAALSNYFIEHEGNGWTLRPENKEAYAFSTRMPKRFATGELPAQTARFRHLSWSLCYQGEAQRTLDVLDYPGEVYRLAFLDPADDPHPESLKQRQTAHADEIRELMAFAKGADQIFVLFNLADAKNLDTSDDNIDAVWVTVQALKIFSSFESKPQLTLLVTQADRLVQENEDISDVAALLHRHAPIIGQHCSRVNALAVSALDAANEKWGLLPIVKMLLMQTELYRLAEPQWGILLNSIRDGEVVLKESHDKLLPSARAFSCISSLAFDIADDKGEVATYLRLEELMENACFGRSTEQGVAALEALDVSDWLECALKSRNRRISSLKEERNLNVGVLLFGFFVVVVLVVFIAFAMTQSSGTGMR